MEIEGAVREHIDGTKRDIAKINAWDRIIGMVLFPVILTLLAASLLLTGVQAGRNHLEKQAIEHGAARYNPTTGEFEWIERDAND